MLSTYVLGACGVLLFFLGLTVFISNRGLSPNRLFAFLTLNGLVWLVANMLVNISKTADAALFWSRFTMIPGSGIAYAFVLFSLAFPGNQKISFFRYFWLGIPWLGLIALSQTNLNIVSVGPGGSGLTTGPAYIALSGYLLAYFILGSYFLWRSYRDSDVLQRQQLIYIFAGMICSFIPALFFDVIYVNTALSAFGPITVVIFTVFCTIAIVKHRLLNIRLVVARSVAYLLLLVTLALSFGIASYAVSNLIFHQQTLSSSSQFFNIILAIILAFIFQPLRRFFEKITDTIFYRDRYDSQEVLAAIGKTLAEQIRLDSLLRDALREITTNLHIGSGRFIIFDGGRIYQTSHIGNSPKQEITDQNLRKLRQTMLVSDELESGDRKQILDDNDIRVSLMLRTRDEFVGYLFLGDKLSGEIYSDQDLRLLEILGRELSIAISNAKAYSQIAQFNVTLQNKVDEATARLRVANHNLKALDKAKDEFLSMASHQLRTPLTTIKGYLSMILEGDSGEINTEQKEFLDYAFDGAERMVSLISDLLNVSRLSAGRFVIEKVPTNLVAVTADEVRQLASHASAKSLELKFNPPTGKFPTINLDEGKTRQVIMNFIDNGIYYTKSGGVYVTLEATPTAIELRVRDTGIGVPEAAKKKLFTKFFRAENAQIARPDGTGLGLYLAKRVIEDQGGTILFESAEGQGSMFGFSMPLK
ncbi:MAG: ATP-binding protein [Candidatus Saccharimonadia bacterium]